MLEDELALVLDEVDDALIRDHCRSAPPRREASLDNTHGVLDAVHHTFLVLATSLALFGPALDEDVTLLVAEVARSFTVGVLGLDAAGVRALVVLHFASSFALVNLVDLHRDAAVA
eukprot:13622571-Heterocapsa_arctica.AAC.1